MTTSARRVVLAVIAPCLFLCGCEPEDLIRNPLVDRWCGDHPCYWEVIGEIRRRPTWHRKDYAVAFVSDDAEIYQVNENANGEDHGCIAFTTVANVAGETALFLELDFLNDGSMEFSEPFPALYWQRIDFAIRAPEWYEGIRFAVRKDGPGTAELAQFSAQVGEADCDLGSTFEVELNVKRPVGAACDANSECASGSCDGFECVDAYDAGAVGPPADDDAGTAPAP